MVKWTSNCDAQKYLEKLFEQGVVNGNMSPLQVQKAHQIFGKYSAAVFRMHWGKTKSMFIDDLSSYRGTNFDIDESTNDTVISTISEIAGPSTAVIPPPMKKPKLDNPIKSTWDISYSTPPVVPLVYLDPDTKLEMVLVSLLLFSDIEKIDIDIIMEGDSQYVIVSHEWPKITYNMEELFKKNGKPIVPSYHPIVVEYEKALKNVRENMEDAPISTLKVKLPIKVKSEPSTWKKEYIKRGDYGTSVFLKFESVGSDYNVRILEKTLIIE